MAHRSFPSATRLLPLIASLFFIGTSAPAWSDEPGFQASESFDQFARSWMDSVHELNAGPQPAIMIDGETGQDDTGQRDHSAVVTFREYGDEFTTELRETGRDAAPYVGLLHYTESIYNCLENDSRNCSEPSTVPVTEIFRYQEGRWIY